MRHRSIQAGRTPTVIIRADRDVQVQGWDDERVLAITETSWGPKIERGSKSALGRVRARAKVGNYVLFDISGDLLKWDRQDESDDAIHVQIGGDAVVHVPVSSAVTIYAGHNIDVLNIRGSVAAYAARDAHLRDIGTLARVSAGRTIDVECNALGGADINISAGRDLRLHVRDLDDATVLIDDLGGYRQEVLGNGRRLVRLTAGGDVVFATGKLMNS